MATAILDFGKYKGRHLCRVPTSYLSYLARGRRNVPASATWAARAELGRRFGKAPAPPSQRDGSADADRAVSDAEARMVRAVTDALSEGLLPAHSGDLVYALVWRAFNAHWTAKREGGPLPAGPPDRLWDLQALARALGRPG